MSNPAVRVRELAEDCLVEVCWRQWQTLTGEEWSSTGAGAQSIVDPEALVLASLYVRDREARLVDRISWWASTGAHLMSVARMRAMLDASPNTLRPGVAWFAGRTQQARWKSLLEVREEDIQARPGKGPAELSLLPPATLMLRLRAAFGVGAKADVLTFLLGASALRGPGFQASATSIADAIQFSPSAVRRATSDMCLAGMIRATPSRPPMLSLDASAWGRVLLPPNPYRLASRVAESDTPAELPAWHAWAHIHALLIACAEWGREAAVNDPTPTVLASRARDIVEAHPVAGTWNGWPPVDGRAAPGARFLDVFEAFVRHVAEWVGRQH